MTHTLGRRAAVTAAAAVVLAGIVTAAGPASAATPGAPAACTPSVDVLPSLPGRSGGEARAFGANALVAGDSGRLPVYWTGPEHTPHAVPLPEGFQEGLVTDVNAKGLMVGSVTRTSDGATAAFTYRQGAAAVQLITAVSTRSGAANVNDAGHVVALDDGVAKEWVDGKVVRELPVPADAHPSARIVSVSGINKRGDIVGTAHSEYYDAANDETVSKTFPVVWPAGGGYPPYSLQIWNEGHWSWASYARDIDNNGRVVGYEHYGWRDDQQRTPALWKKPYDALPTSPGKVAGYKQLTLEAISPSTNVSVGTAMTFEEGFAQYTQAALWSGKGAPLALPHPAGADRYARSSARTVSDDDRVGGTYWDMSTVSGGPLVWNCASRQAYAPQG
ncbi:hypothetical protein [Streptomyces sp. NPDC048606]|uniref:hypothetical protein n=1 Tax=Streptomyces sp. NPDC048606 TaxID=3154726 RepID=UPI003435A084